MELKKTEHLRLTLTLLQDSVGIRCVVPFYKKNKKIRKKRIFYTKEQRREETTKVDFKNLDT